MSDAEEVCRAATTATHAFYREHHAALGNRGYAVLYGPPKPTPPVLFIGYQPGGRELSETHLRPAPPSDPWPDTLEYATDTYYPLARRLQEIFGPPLLRECVAVNALFFCSPDVKTWRAEVPLSVRRSAANLCLPWVERIVAVVAPRLVVAIGLDTLELFTRGEMLLANGDGRWLASTGKIAGVRAIATLHLSGARIATPDRAAITQLLRNASGDRS